MKFVKCSEHLPGYVTQLHEMNNSDIIVRRIDNKSIIKEYFNLYGAEWGLENFEWLDESPDSDGWIGVEIKPEYLEGKDYSANVLAIVEGHKEMQVMCWVLTDGEDENGQSVSGGVWANCYGDINDDEPEWDDEYKVIKWRKLPLPPNK